MSGADAADDDRVVVIGSGPAGAIAAATLVGQGIAVTLLDAGRSAPRGLVVRAHGNTLFRSVDRTQLELDRHDQSSGNSVEWPSSRSLGGLSNYWTGATPRFAPEDFTEGGLLDERYVWPITYNDLAQYYALAESYLVVTAGGSFANVPGNVNRFTTSAPDDWERLSVAAEEHGWHLHPIPMAKGRPWMVARRSTEFNSYHCILAPLLASPRLTLRTGAQVTALEIDGDEACVRRVRFVDRATGEVGLQRCRAVMVAAGAIDTTTLLLRSTSPQFPQGIGNSRGLVGRYLHDHPREWWRAVPDTSMRALSHPLYLSRGPYDDDSPLMATSLTLGLADRRHRLLTYAGRKVDAFGVQVFGTMVPRPELGVRLPDRYEVDDPEIRPRISIQYDQREIDNLEHSRVRLVEMFRSGGAGVVVPGPFHELTPGSSVHFGGSVRMHASPEFGVLDAWNRMYEVPNVVVCDSSCFTTGPEKNPTLTAMAIASRAASNLARQLRS